MHDDATPGRPPLDKPFDVVLGHELSPHAKRFAAEHADFLVRVDFKNIADHPDAQIRSAEGYYSCTGARHTIWLDTKSSGFEALIMHKTMRGILMSHGFPKTARPLDTAFCASIRYLSSLLESAVTDPIIDGWLTKGGYGVYDREVLTRRAIGQVWLDAPQPIPEPYTFLFCKWTLLTVLLMLDPTFEGETVDLLHAIIRRNFREPWELGDELSKSITKKGFTEPKSALVAMLELRSALKLQDRIAIVDAEGIRW